MDDEVEAEALADAAVVIMEEGIAEAETEAVFMTEEEALKTEEDWGMAVLRTAVATETADEVALVWTPGAWPMMVK